MKVLVCHNFYKTTSGEDIVIRADLALLRSAGSAVVEYTRNNAETEGYSGLEYLRSAAATVYSRRTVADIESLVRTERPDVAFVQNVFPLISPSVYYALRRMGVPVVQLVYNYRLVCPNATLYTNGRICERCVGGNYWHAVRNRCFRNSLSLSALYAGTLAAHRHVWDMKTAIAAYLTPDLFLRNKLIAAGYPADAIFTCNNPFAIDEYRPSYAHAGYFLFAGRVVREKGIFTAMRAMKLLPEHRLVVIGGGESEGAAREFATQQGLKNVDFLGPRYGPDLLTVLAGARAVLVPSEWFDNCPVILQQAFACGKPVIASDINGIPEVVSHRENGLLFAPGDATALAAAMATLAGDEPARLELARNARRKAETEFTPARRLRGLAHVITRVTGQKLPLLIGADEELSRT
jgi:glycosyltransferase involved in cell wall biosynthesis